MKRTYEDKSCLAVLGDLVGLVFLIVMAAVFIFPIMPIVEEFWAQYFRQLVEQWKP